MGRDVGDRPDGDQAAWIDLVARLEVSPANPAAVPWPDRENLTDRSRVIRPASSKLSADATGNAAEPRGEDPDGDFAPAAGNHPESASGAPAGEPGAEITHPDADHRNGFTDPEPWRPSARNMSAEDYLNLVDVGYVDYDIGDQDDHYIPPPPPPQPKLDPVARGGWAALLGGPGYLFIGALLGWQTPGWAQLAAVTAFIAGFVVLVFRLGDGPSKRDGPDQGAVV
jgi:hypothetical protein